MPDDVRTTWTIDRGAWRARRQDMERGRFRHTVKGIKPYGFHLGHLRSALGAALWCGGLASVGYRNAASVHPVHKALSCAGLPPTLHGYRILHLSDLHMNFVDAPFKKLLREARHLEVDLCVITGDFMESHGHPETVHGDRLKELADTLAPKDGIFGVLGNHDSYAVVEFAEAAGIRMLVNETVVIEKAGTRLVLTGTDDVHCFFTDDALAALKFPPEGFRIALVHSPEIADIAARHGYDLYLTGHTHGGQICYPGGRPVFRFLERHAELYRGIWTLDGMTGHTTTGLGVTIVASRLNSRGEIPLLELTHAS